MVDMAAHCARRELLSAKALLLQYPVDTSEERKDLVQDWDDALLDFLQVGGCPLARCCWAILRVPLALTWAVWPCSANVTLALR